MEFHKFKEAIQKQFERMSKYTLFETSVDKYLLWDAYLQAFPENTNVLYRERTEHDCSCCKQFIRNIGGVVAFIEGKMTTIWNTKIDDPVYQTVADLMDIVVSQEQVTGPYFHYEPTVGTDKNNQMLDSGITKTWEHFHVKLPKSAVLKKDHIDSARGIIVTNRQMYERAIREIKPEAVETVLELIAQGSLYRGDEHKKAVSTFRSIQGAILRAPAQKHDEMFWLGASDSSTSVLRIRNTSIGTLLVDLSEGTELDTAVAKFEAMVAPANYKRPTAVVTKAMIKKAEEAVQALGFLDALERRHARKTDITVNNVLYADRDVRSALGGSVFDTLKEEAATVNPQKLSKVEEISIEDFIKNVLPKAEKVELLMENSHTGNLVSLIAPVHPEANNMLQWDNNFSWTYKGDVTDSMKERVKAAGGKVDGVMRFSIQWNDGELDQTDLDAHCKEPGSSHDHIYFANRRVRSGGNLDVDIIYPKPGQVAVENITWPDERKMQQGTYHFYVHCFNKRGSGKFSAEFEYRGVTHSYIYNKPLKQGENITVIKGKLERGTFQILEELPSIVSTRQEWGIKTMNYQRVSLIMNSPNHWDGMQKGNKHYFFILDGCKQPGTVRGFYNEFLTDKLREHRKVFEVLGNKMRVEESDEQLTGLGFSSTVRASIHCRVSGSFNRNLKINF